MVNSRSKGKRGELELALYFRDRGYQARRGRQFHGGQDSPDLVLPDLPHIHPECKRCERGSLYDWLDQAIADAATKTPVVMHRRSQREWVAILRLDDFLTLIKK